MITPLARVCVEPAVADVDHADAGVLCQQLGRSPTATHTRTDLLERVWDTNYDGFSNVVDVHVGHLRRKLALPGLPDPIETVRGVGYRLRQIEASP